MDEEKVDLKRRKFLLAVTSLVGSVGAAFAAVPFIAAWMPSAKAKAQGAPVEVDVTSLEAGQMVVVQWRSRPVWILRRTQAMLDELSEHDERLRDPQCLVQQQPAYAKNVVRSRRPDLLVLIGVCTHLGCIPKYKPQLGELGPDWAGGFFCPCHGSKFDLSGRVYKGVPAPINMEVPPYSFLSDNRIIIGVDEQHKAQI